MSTIGSLVSAVTAGRMGFCMDEVMSGEHEFEPGLGEPGRHPMEFRVTWGSRDLPTFFDPRSPDFLRAEMRGVITVGGLCQDAACEGSLHLRYFSDRTLRYALSFEVDGRRYRYEGHKVNIRLWNLPVSHTTCFGTLTEADSGKLISRSVTFFQLWRGPQFLASLRLVRD